jgi:hypothetical protein
MKIMTAYRQLSGELGRFFISHLSQVENRTSTQPV